MTFVRHARVAAAAALLAVGSTACGAAAPGPSAVPAIDLAALAHPPASSVQLVQRLAEQSQTVLPDLSGLTVAEAEHALGDLTVQVVRFNRRGGPVTAQWPPAGEPAPADGVVVVWQGRPPHAKAPAPAPVTTASVTPMIVEPAPAGATEAPALVVPAQPAPGGRTPGLEDMVPPPHPPRSNIREMAHAQPGTTMKGRASWYGPGFAGHTTACGGVFDPAELTLASRELRCGTCLLYTSDAADE